jgi:hypothetical protein
MLAGGDPTGGGHGLLCYKSFLSQGALMMEEDPGAGGNSIGGTVLGGLPTKKRSETKWSQKKVGPTAITRGVQRRREDFVGFF